MTRKRDPGAWLDALDDELVDGILRADEEALDAMLRADGLDPDAVAAGVRGHLDTASRNFRTRALQAAREKRTRSLAQLHDRRHCLPGTPGERRALLDRTLRGSATAREALTLQHREFQDMTDADVESLLTQLAALNALPPIDDSDGEPP